MAIRGTTLIKRYSLPIYHRNVTETQTGGWDNVTEVLDITTEEGKRCTLQSVNKNEFTADVSGLVSTDAFTLYTQTPVYAPISGTGFLGSGVYIPDSFFGLTGEGILPQKIGGYFNCIEVHPHQNGVIQHYKALIVKDYTPEADKYPVQKVIDTTVDMDTLEKYKQGAWVTGWVS